ncbi:hypothetical protein O181_008491 [Austropuccinia psidii MF-1]|uniref:Uncharacterized protein n=1 Tax=Austropuccinia psidii MF-1 TaxID=1389203 RepID=A0A9Q3GIK3_9BASI|nr:hypothetical protein [Austropuccinia psidii MF-1]
MVHTRNGRNYSVQPDRSGQGRGNIRASSGNSSSTKKCLEDYRVAPHSPRSVPTNFDVNSEPELIQGNLLWAELFPSVSHRDISVPVQKLVKSSQGRGVGNMPKPLAGGHELLLIHQELSGSGEYNRALRRVKPIIFQRQSQKDKELVEEPKYFIRRPEEGVGNEPIFGERRPSGVYQLQKFPNTSPKDLRGSRNVTRTFRQKAKAKKVGTDLTQKGTGSSDWNLQ